MKKYLRKSPLSVKPWATTNCTFHTQTQYNIMSAKRNRFLLLAAFLLAALGLQAQPPCNLDVQVETPIDISCQNPSVQLQTTVTPGGNYSYVWWGPAQLPNVPNPTVTVAGTYMLSVFDSLGLCFGGDTVLVNQDGTLPAVSIAQVGGTNCDGTRTLTAVTTPGSPNDYTYLWSNGATTQSTSIPPGHARHCPNILRDRHQQPGVRGGKLHHVGRNCAATGANQLFRPWVLRGLARYVGTGARGGVPLRLPVEQRLNQPMATVPPRRHVHRDRHRCQRVYRREHLSC
jgi:hypothetical protein